MKQIKNTGFLLLMYGLLPMMVAAQNTGGTIGGAVKTISGEVLTGAVVSLIHEPTGTKISCVATKKGLFRFNNLMPGGPWQLEASFMGFKKERVSGFFINLGEGPFFELSLYPIQDSLRDVTVTAFSAGRKNNHNSASYIMDKNRIENSPSIGRNIYDYLHFLPNASLVAGNEGAVSFDGQNNRYNSFYIDGAINNDVFGLSPTGTNGGQAGINPVSADAIEQLEVILSPYDASFGNFTGAAINAVTRAGSNKTESSFYHFFSAPSFSGKLPVSGRVNEFTDHGFSSRTSGIRLQGPFTANKLFYFINAEFQRDYYPKPFDFSTYNGNTQDIKTIDILSNTIKSVYRYNPGNFLDDPESVFADRLVVRLDWNAGKNSHISVSNRYANGQKINTYSGDAYTIHFSNNGYLLKSFTNSTSIEWKKQFSNNFSNKLMVTYTQVTDHRTALDKPFPRVRINDGEGAVIFGTDNSSTVNSLIQHNWSLFNKINFLSAIHNVSAGIDAEYNAISNAFIQNSYGNYSFSSIADFLTNAHPSAYQLGFMLPGVNNKYNTSSFVSFAVLKTAFFLNDEIRPSQKLSLHFGIRADSWFFLTKPPSNEDINNLVIPVFKNYYTIENARSGGLPGFPVSLSPRFELKIHWPEKFFTIRTGAGIFSGRMPLVWPGGIYFNNGLYAGAYQAESAQLYKMRFRPDPYKQWMPSETGATVNRIPLNFVTEKMKMPSLLKLSFAIEKKLMNGLQLKGRLLAGKNITEMAYANINLLPPLMHASGPDNRNVYDALNNGRIPLGTMGSNPYDYAILLSNNVKQKGYSWHIETGIEKNTSTFWNWEINYSFGKSAATNDGTSSVNASQWRFMEAVNGRNYPERSESDFSPGHIINVSVLRQLSSASSNKKFSLIVTYTGHSGTPFSYVYGDASITRDDGIALGYDLLYVPTVKDLDAMIFLPNTTNGITWDPLQQKEAMNAYILNDPYLRQRRGQYAERNGSRTPFTNRFDLTLKQDFSLKTLKNRFRLQLTLDVCNIGNLINPNWGWQYNMPFNSYPLVSFAGFQTGTGLVPQYRFDPRILQKKIWNLQTGSNPVYASSWTAQFGFRCTFN